MWVPEDVQNNQIALATKSQIYIIYTRFVIFLLSSNLNLKRCKQKNELEALWCLILFLISTSPLCYFHIGNKVKRWRLKVKSNRFMCSPIHFFTNLPINNGRIGIQKYQRQIFVVNILQKRLEMFRGLCLNSLHAWFSQKCFPMTFWWSTENHNIL